MTQPQPKSGGILSAIGQIVLIIAIVGVTRTVAAEAFYVPSGSMQPTLLIGDELVVTKFSYGYSRYSMPFGIGPARAERLFGRLPARGDVVVFRLPSDPSQTYVKRVVGLPGDRLQMRDGRLWIDDTILPVRKEGLGPVEMEDGGSELAAREIETLPGGREHPIFKFDGVGGLDNTEVFEVSPGHVFVMGDNRDDSADSRLAPADGGVGLVPVENLVGRVDVVIGSWDLGMAHNPIWTWPAGLRLSRFFSRVN
jgi:signal peptidase I